MSRGAAARAPKAHEPSRLHASPEGQMADWKVSLAKNRQVFQESSAVSCRETTRCFPAGKSAGNGKRFLPSAASLAAPAKNRQVFQDIPCRELSCPDSPLP